MLKRLLIVAILVFLLGCSGTRDVRQPAENQASPSCKGDLTADEYAAYSALLLHKFSGGRLVISDHTGTTPKPSSKSSYDTWASDHWQRCEAMIPPSEPSMLAQFRNRNGQPHALARNFDLPDYLLVTSEEIKKRMGYDIDKPGGGGVGEVYPDAVGVFSLSSVGFDEGRKRAVVYVVRGACGRGCGEGFCVLLSKENCEWKVEKAATFWMG